MSKRQYFKNVVFEGQEAIKPGQKKVHIEWIFDDLSTHEIARKSDGTFAIFPGCGCTADIEVLSDRIVARYNDSTKLGKNSSTKVGKTVRVFMDDGEPLYIKNERGVSELNSSNKENALLSFSLVVKN